jgi:replicative DNA helicase
MIGTGSEIGGKELEEIKGKVERVDEELNEVKKDVDKRKKEEAIKTISRISIGKNLKDIIKEIEAEKDSISTGFPNLDEALGSGGFREGCLYAIGSGTSMGKTTFVTNIADNIALSDRSDIKTQTEQNSAWRIPDGKKVLIFSLETNRKKFLLKSLSKLMCKLDTSEGKLHSKTAVEIAKRIKTKGNWKGESELLYSTARNDYRSYRNRIFIEGGVEKFGVGKIQRTVECFETMGKMPSLVIIDYLQLMDPFDSGRFDLGYNIARNVTALKALCEKFKIPIILISSFNRENYLTEAGLESFKGSGEIEYSSDVVMALQPRLLKKEEEKDSDGKLKRTLKEEREAATREAFKEAMKQTPRQIDLVILKNRDFAPWEKVKFRYYPKYDYFEEMEKDDYFREVKEQVFEEEDRVHSQNRELPLKEAYRNTAYDTWTK